MATQFGRATWLLLGAFVLGVLLSCGGGGDDRSGDGTSAAPANDIGISGARTGVVGTGSVSAGRLPDADTASGTSASGPGSIDADPTTGLPRRLAAARFAAPTSTDVQAQAAAAAAATFAAPNFTSEVLATLAPFTVVGMAWAPDGRLFVWQKNGIVRVIKQGVLLTTPFIDLSAKVNTFDDRGFWGLAFHPNFAANGYVYLTYVYEGGGNPNDQSAKTSRLTRVTANPSNPDVALPGSEVIVLGTIGTAPCSAQPAGADCIPADGGSHTLGSLQFAADGKLFVGNGDGSDGDALSLRAQDINSYSGKILRINDDGTAPSDNPFYDGTNSIRSKVWLYGVRNPFGYDIHTASGDIYFGEVGWNTWEEVDRGQRGANYGWPCYEGAGLQPFFQSFAQCQQLSPSAVKPPVYTYDRSVGAAAIGGSFYTASLYPTEYRDNFFFADYVGGWIQRVVVDASGAPLSIQPFATNVEAPVTVKMGPDGMLYYLSFTTGQINRIRFNGTQAVASATPVHGYSPLSVAFSSAGSADSGGGSLSYLWEFGDGTTSTQANPTHVYSAPSVVTYTPKLTVTNAQGASSSATLSVTVGSQPPLPVISTPGPGTSVMPGQSVTFQGSATDPDEQLPASALSWTVLLHHNTHVHTFVSGAGTQGSFVAENHGPVGTFSYEIVLTATDSSGLKASTSVFVAAAADTAAPSATASLTAVAGAAGQINLGWTAATDNAAVTGYRVERCLGAGCSNFAQVATPVTTSFTDSGLAAGTSYSYRVRAADASGNLGGYSNVATAVTTSTPPPTGLVAAYALNEGAGTTITDASGSGNTGTISGGFAWSTAGRSGGALSFNGVNSLVRVASSASLNLGAAMTLEAWIQPTAAQSGWRTIVQREVDAYFLNASNDGSPLGPAGGGTLGGATVFVSGPTANPINVWTHVALTYNGTTLRLYVNGVQAASQARTGSIQASSNPLWIGGNSPHGEYFQGLIDEIRIYNRALTQAEIQADMAAPIAPAASDPTPPSVPTNLTATVLNATQINLGWTASTDNVAVTGYQVERCQGVGCTNFAQVGAPVVAAFSDTGLAPGTSYTYRVRAADAAGNFSGYSNAASGTTPSAPDTTAPTAPTGLSASAAGASQINLSWTASTDNVGVTGYRVERCLGAGCSNFAEVATPVTTSFADSGLASGTSYSYRVRAADASGNLGGYSNVATAVTTSTPPPTGLVAAYALNEGAGTTITDASGSGNTGTISGGFAWSTAGRSGGALSFNGVNSLVRVASSASLNLGAAMTLEAWIQPTAAQSGWRTIVQREFDAYFLNASNDSGPLRPSGGGTLGGATVFVSGTTASPINAWTHVALTYNGTTLQLYVNGVQAASQARTGSIQASSSPLWIGGNSPYGEYFQGLIDEIRIYNRALTQAEIQADMAAPIAPAASDPTPPSVPANLTATVLNATQINLSWTASTDNVAVTGYQVERCQGVGCTNFAQVGAPVVAAFSNTGLAPGTSYTYRVRAADAAGNFSGYSNAASGTTQSVPDTTAPTAPSGLSASAAGTTQINLSWTASTDNVAVTGYRVERCQGVGCTNFAQVGAPVVAAFSNTGLAPGTSYTYRVRAADAAGNFSGYSNAASGTTLLAPDPTPPSVPANLTATVLNATQINLSWTASTDNVAVTGYQVERCQGVGCTNFALVGAPVVAAFSNTGLAPGTSYTYRVRATDAAGNFSGYSNSASGTTPFAPDTTAPTAPTGLSASAAGNSQVNLSWTASTDNVGVTAYRVERCQGNNCSNFVEVGTSATTAFSSTGLSANTRYRFRVRASDAAGNLGPYSNIAAERLPR